MTAAQPGQPGNFWLTNRGVVAICFVALELIFFSTDAVGVPAHEYVRGDVGGTPYQSVWFTYAFLIPAALIMPLLGSLREKVGAKRIATFGPGLFGVAAVLSAMATDPQLFIVMRALQGLGAGVIPAAAGGYLGGQLGEKYTPMGKGLVGLALVTGSSAGIPLSGFITWYTASLVVGNQREWFQSASYVLLLVVSLLLIALFVWRVVSVPKLINLRIFQDINYCISLMNLTALLFFLFFIFAIVPRFLTVVVDNTIENYAWSFVPFVGTTVLAGVMVTPGVSPHLLTPRISDKKKLCSAAVLLFAGTALWMANTCSDQSNTNITLQLAVVGVCFGLINCLEIQMCFTTMAAELMTSASSVLFFCTNLAKAVSGGVSGAILTATSQGSWERFREQFYGSNPPLAPFQEPLSGHAAGIHSDTWSQASLELINKAIVKQAEVVTFINVSTMVGCVLLLLSVLPLLHRSPQKP